MIVGIAGNAVENVVGDHAGRQGADRTSRCRSIKNSVAQIAAFLFPVLVLLSLFFDDRLTFVLNPVYIGALALTAIAVWQITGDGEAVAFEGWALVGIYVMLAARRVLRVASCGGSALDLRSSVSSRHAPGARPSTVRPA